MNSLRFVAVMLAVLALHEALAARILALLPLDIASHHQFCQPIVRELAKRGHELTVLTPIEDAKAPKNMKQILLPRMSIYEAMKDMHSNKKDYFKDDADTVYTNHMSLWNATLKMSETAMNSQAYQNFLANDKTKYELIIYEAFYHEAFLVHAAKYNAPFVAISTFGQAHFINQFTGNPYEISYASHEFLGYAGRFKFIERFKNAFWTTVELFERWKYLLPANFDLAKKYSLVPNLPEISDVQKNVSLVLTNSHFSMYGVRPYLPGIVEVGGVHIDESEKLPQNIKKFMDDAKEGVIYFSFGSTVKSLMVPEDVVQMFIKVFAGLKQRVLWKWDDETIKGKPKNVMTVKWLPQVSVLGHPNVKLFINQGGGLSMQESVSQAVPVLCLPLFGDQFGNCARAKHTGYGETMVTNQLTKDDLENTIHKLLNDKTYKENAMKVSSIYKDRPLSPIDTAMYWIEYVIRHKGAPHLSSPAKEQYWYEYYSIDVILSMGLTIYYIYFILNWMFWNVALRKPIDREHLRDLREQHKPKVLIKED